MCQFLFTQQICNSEFMLYQILAYYFIPSFIHYSSFHLWYSKLTPFKNIAQQCFSASKRKNALKWNKLLTLRILPRASFQSPKMDIYIHEITLNYHSTNLLLYFIDSGTELFFNSPKFWLKLHARTPMFKLGSSTQTVARDDVSLRIKLKI